MLRMKQIYSSAARATFQERQSIIGTSIIGLLEFLQRLPDDPTALSVVVLSSYLTWSKRSIYWDNESSLARPRQTHMKFGLDDDLDDGDKKELDEEQINRVHYFRPRIFGRIITDEAQKLKTPATVMHRSVYDLQAPSVSSSPLLP